MLLPVKRSFAIAFLCTSFAIGQPAAFAASDWEIIKVSGRDYLSVDNISRFYGLPAGIATPAEKVRLETVKNPLEFVSGSREAMINGARSWLCFPLIEQDGKFLVSRTDVGQKQSEPLVRPHRVANVGKVQTVVLDPGHGGHDKGQVSRYGCEKDFVLDVARKLRPLLQAKGLRVIMTREGDYLCHWKYAHRSPTRRAIQFSSAFTSMGRMIIRALPGSKFFHLRRAGRHRRLTAQWR